MGLDKVNLRILALLETNARQSATAIGRTIGLSRTAVQDRIARLERDGIIQGHQVRIAPDVAHPLRAVLFVDIAQRPFGPAFKWLAAQSGVQSVLSLAGECDALMQVVVASPEVLIRLNDTVGSHPLIAQSKAQIVLEQIDK